MLIYRRHGAAETGVKQMKPQNASVYTRRFNQLKRELIQYFAASTDDFSADVSASDTASLRWSSESCIVAHDGSLGFTLYFYDADQDQWQPVQIVKTRSCSKLGLVGIHVRETDFSHLLSCIDDALNKGFESIYVESIASTKEAANG